MNAPWNHTTVLLSEAADALFNDPGAPLSGVDPLAQTYVDATFGRGGHSRLILSRLKPQGRLIAFDKDPDAVAHAASISDPRFSIRHEGFALANCPEPAWLASDGSGRESPQSTPSGVSVSGSCAGYAKDTTRNEWSMLHDGRSRNRGVIRDYGEERFVGPCKAIVAPTGTGLSTHRTGSRRHGQNPRVGPEPCNAHFRLFGFSSTPSLKSCNKR